MLAVDKPMGWTSADVVRRLKSLLEGHYRRLNNGKRRKIKVGHGGTLDPLATGVLVIGIGTGCKALGSFLKGAKEYRTIGLLGVETDTLDSDGVEVENRPWEHVDMAAIQSVLPEFTGVIEQIPPMYSALKKDGQRLYDLAYQGKTVERKAREVTVNELELLFDGTELPEFSLRMQVSGGTYVRTLVSDIARRCNSRAHVVELERTQQGPFFVGDAIPEEKWVDLDELCRHLVEADARGLQ